MKYTFTKDASYKLFMCGYNNYPEIDRLYDPSETENIEAELKLEFNNFLQILERDDS